MRPSLEHKRNENTAEAFFFWKTPPHNSILLWINEFKKFGSVDIMQRSGLLFLPPCISDLTPLDFFMWEFVRTKVYHTSRYSLTQLKRRVTSTICSNTTEPLQDVWRNAQDSLIATVKESKCHIECLLRYANALIVS